MQAEQTGKLVVSLAMIAVLLVLGYRRRDMFLTRGDLRVPIQPVPLLGFPKPDPWTSFGLQWGFYIAIALGVVLYLVQRPGGEAMLKVVPVLPSILFYSALNAFNEEVTYRVPMLTTLEPTGGSIQALWMSAYFFGNSPLLWYTRRDPGRNPLDLYGMDIRQGDGRDARLFLGMVDSFPGRYFDLYAAHRCPGQVVRLPE